MRGLLASLCLLAACDGLPLNPDEDGDGVPVPTDCDDADPDVFPAAGETCADGVDNDCDGYAAECGPAGWVPLQTADARVTPAPGTVDFDSFGAGADATGDGYDDIVVGSIGTEGDEVQLHLLSGPLVADVSLSDLEPNIRYSTEAYRAPTVTLSDMDGDGLAELVVANSLAKIDENRFSEVLVFGAPTRTGLTSDDAEATFQVWDTQYEPTLKRLGDTDGDGVGGFLLAVNHVDSGGVGGGAWVVQGPAAGATAISDVGIQLIGGYGTTDVASGDMNGDGLDDVLVSADDEQVVYLAQAPFFGDHFLADADATLSGDGTSAEFGSLLAAGDTDADGYADTAVVGWASTVGSSDGSTTYVFRGPLAGTLSLDAASTVIEASGGNWLESAAIPGDTNGDGRADLLLGSPYGCWSRGCAYLFYGGFSGTVALDEANAVLVGEEPGDSAGEHVFGAGDVDADGMTDVLVSARGHRTEEGAYGAAYLVFGGPGF
ncbi:hypothetical protein LBMAG42_40330 [Deltaproteobacteria bacterium]|nr:hypothetical protein LBMAG42_40330 [Deltaproteobacteria bacterium]